MACQFRTVANFVDISVIKKLLFNSTGFKAESTLLGEGDGDIQDRDSSERQNSNKDDNWVKNCLFAISPTCELVVVANKQTMLIFAAKWDSNEENSAKTKYNLTWSGEPCQETREEITSVLCIPLASQSKSSAHCAPDWTAIAVGYSSGAIRFYTENGSLLLSEVLHEEPITALKCQSYQFACHSSGFEQSEELHVIYKNVVCCVVGYLLCNTLRTCRSQLARVQANCADASPPSVEPLLSRKFIVPEQGTVSDLCVGAMQSPTAFSHLVTASICGGFYAGYRTVAPQSSFVIATGSKPFVGFHYAIEGSSVPGISDVAKAVAQKLKSAIGQAVPGWFMGGGKKTATPPQEKPKDIVEPAEPMICRFGLCDLWREGDKIVLSPNRKLSVVRDSLGRIILIDNSSGISVRMWKGYRNAECGWIIEEEDARGDKKRTALFLVIYAPKKSLIEIWAMQQGPRIAAFPASKYGRLFYLNYNLLGLGKQIISKRKINYSSACMFLDQNGVFREINVPFHCILSDKNSKRSKDVLLLKKLKSTLKEEGGLSEVVTICKELQTYEIKVQCLDLLCTFRFINANVMLDVINLFSGSLEPAKKSSADSNEKDEKNCQDMKLLEDRCNQLEHLITFYEILSKIKKKPPDYNAIVSENSVNDDAEKLCKLIHTTQEEVDRVILVTDNMSSSAKMSRVSFKENTANLCRFLMGFKKYSSETNAKIDLVNNLVQEKIVSISELVCQGCVDGNCTVEEWQNAACESSISPITLISLAITFWINKVSFSSATIVLEMIRFSELVKAICLIANERINWWDHVRKKLRDSSNTLSSLTAALVCRSIASTMENIFPDFGDENNPVHSYSDNDVNENKEITDEVGELDEPMKIDSDDFLKDDSASCASDNAFDWENISQDICQWNHLISQLEDVALLHSVLSKNIVLENQINQNLNCLDYNNPEISLGLVLSKGEGSIPEMVAKWLTTSGINPNLLLENQYLENSNDNSDSMEVVEKNVNSLGVKEGVAEKVDNSVEAQPFSEKQNLVVEELAKLRKHFPYSLSSDNLLANLCWEYILAWNKDVDSLTNLLSAINCLKVIKNPHLKQGLCSMVWSTHIRLRFEPALRLINKVGKVPKEQLCRQDIGMSDLQISDFFNFCSDFIDVYLETSVLSQTVKKVALLSESLWEGCSSVPSLSRLAYGQPSANYELLHIFSEASRAMLLLTNFNLKIHRPLAAFFDSLGQSALFCDIWATPQLPSHSKDMKLDDSRTKFLLMAVSASMKKIYKRDNKWETREGVKWMTECLALASDWNLPADEFRMQQACQLYYQGFDVLAEEVANQVNDTDKFATHLLNVTGQRLKKMITGTNTDMRNDVLTFNPFVTNWFKELDEGNIEMSTIRETTHLAVKTLNIMSDTHPKRRLARLLVDSIEPLSQTDKYRVL